MQIVFRHPLSLGLNLLIMGSDAGNISVIVGNFLKDELEFEIISRAPRDSENIRLLKNLRGAFDLPGRRSLPAVGWALVEEGILTQGEAEWIEEADVEPDG